MRKVVSLTLLSMFLGACASNDVPEDVKIEPINYIDLSLDDQRELAKEYWVVQKRKEPKYPISAVREGLSGCVDLIVGINKEGKLNGYKIKSSYPQGVFDNYAAAALNKWQWAATDKNKNKAPVLTSIQFDFMVSGSKNKTEPRNSVDSLTCNSSNK
ncbi:energy transducer TonB [Shewanella sp. MEBiC00475]|uniref:energy transducer TonB n=1 Tax=Shewanella sp. MEBiC00475 TaxID=2575361 RepID=UPI0010C050F5|nr:energy transducer TonB [Shewanella sp. MEBiC00475]